MIDSFKALTLKFSSTYIGRLFSSILSAQGLISIAILSLLVSTAARFSGVPIAGELLDGLVAALMAGYGLAIMRHQTTSAAVGLPSINPRNIIKMLTDGTIALVLKSGLGIGLAIAGGMLGGVTGAIAGFIYGFMAMAHYAASEETLPIATDQASRLSRGMKSISSVADLRTVIGSAFAKPINTILALAASAGVMSGAAMLATSIPAMASIAAVVALVTTAHVWSQVYRLAGAASHSAEQSS